MDFKSLNLSPPSLDNIQCYVLGGGVGECIVMHIGHNKWMVVDSFINRESGNPIALDLLASLSISPNDVSYVVATHWHDDHIKGISKVYTDTTNASFVMPSALTSSEFLEVATLQQSHKKILTSIDTGVDELRKVLDIANQRKSSGKTDLFCLASKNKTIFEDTQKLQKIMAISPSDEEFKNAIIAFKRFIPDNDNAPKKRVPNPAPNDTAIVLTIDTPMGKFILGSDLEHTPDPDSGWQSAHRAALGKGKALFFKISHHGSEGAHYGPVWSDLLDEGAHTVVTPYNNSHIPKKDDLVRIGNLRSNSHIAGGLPEKRFARSKTVDKTINQYVKNIKSLPSKVGLVKYEIKTGDTTPTVTYFGAAQDIKTLLQALPK